MKAIKEALDDLQVVCLKSHSIHITAHDLANSRKALVSAIRQSLVELGAAPDYLYQFDKAFDPDVRKPSK